MTKHKGNVVLGAQVGEPVPAKYTLDTDDDIVQIGENQLKEHFRVGFDIRVHDYFSLVIEDAHLHCARMQIDPAIVFVLLFVEFHRFSLLSLWKRFVRGNNTLPLRAKGGNQLQCFLCENGPIQLLVGAQKTLWRV